ncbi:AI-2E family transporter [Leptolyngbya sp. 7M]|uniref:AI-2E family transporter n=1 Tax=Leptolyngbya sp. 7M TaxID=2812896 RepID=UPI001B8D4DA2|nr:AI-2E family transporter [Leptolyngbya sp. 7M]QYO68251.1 AI-2E family transporter [Leptolyngbya sp. 7M]
MDEKEGSPISSEEPTIAVPEGTLRPKRPLIDSSWPSVGAVVRIVVVTLILLFIANRLEVIITSLTYLFFLLVIAIFLAYLIDPLVKLIRLPFKSRGLERVMPRSLAIVLAFILVFGLLGTGISYIAPRVVQQGKELGESLPAFAISARQTLNDLNRRFDRLRIPEEFQSRISDQAAMIGQQVTAAFGNAVINAVTYMPFLVVVPFLTFFLLKDINSIRLAVLRFFPAGRLRVRADAVMQDINSTLAAYTRAQLISCVLIGTICTIGFYFLGLRYALLLGILAGIFEFVPLLGPLSIGIIATTTAAFGQDPWRALYVAIFLIALRIFHDYVTYPRIVRGGLHLHPLLIILSVLAGEQVAGIPGVFVAIPLVALFTVIYRHVLEHRGTRTLFDGIGQDTTSTTAEENY